MTIGTKTSAIRSASALDRGLRALGPPDELDDPGQRRVTADPRRAHDEGAGDVARRADDRVAGPDRTGTGSPVSIEVSTSEPPSTTVPSTGTVSPGRTRRRSPTRTASSATSRSLPSATSRAVAGLRPTRRRIAPAVRTLARASSQRPRRTSPMTIVEESNQVTGSSPAAMTTSGSEGDDDAVAPGRGRPDRHQGVHVGGAVAGGPPGRPVEAAPGPDLDERGREDHEPVEIDQGQRHRRREHQDHDPERDRDRGDGLDQQRPRLACPLDVVRGQLGCERAGGVGLLAGRPRRGRRSRPPRWRRPAPARSARAGSKRTVATSVARLTVAALHAGRLAAGSARSG